MSKKFSNIFILKTIFLVIVFFVSALSFNHAFAAVKTWTGTTSNAWATGTNWSGGVAPVAGDDLVFPTGTLNKAMNNNVTAATSFTSIDFSDSGYSVTGNSITLGTAARTSSCGAVVSICDSSASGGNSMALAMAFTAVKTMNVLNAGETLSLITGAKSGTSGGITKTGAGVLNVAGTNSFTGAVLISAGTYKNGSATGTGSTAGGVTISSGATWDLNGTAVGTEAITSITGTGVGGNGALINSSATTASHTGTIVLATPGATFTANNPMTLSGAITGTGFALTLDGTSTSTLNTFGRANMSTGGTLIKNGIGMWTTNASSSSYTGATTINAGILKAGSATATGSVAGGVTIALNGTFDLNGKTIGAEAFNINGTGAFGTNGVIINSSATGAIMSGAITLAGASKINASVGTIGITTGAISLAGFVLTLDGTTASSISSAIGSTGSGSIIKNGIGSWTLSGVNTFSGGSVIKAGSLIGATSASVFGSGAITLGDVAGSSASLLGNSSLTFANAINLVNGAVGTLTIGRGTTAANVVFSGPIALNGKDLTVSIASANTGTLKISGGITGTGNVTTLNNSTSIITLGTNSINNVGTVTNTGGVGSGGVTISAVVGINVTGLIQNAASSPMNLITSTNTFGNNGSTTFGLQVKNGTVKGSVAGSFGSGTITLGDSAGGSASILVPTTVTIANPIILGTNAVGTLNVGSSTSSAANFSGGINLNGGTVTLYRDGATSIATNFSGGITGTGNVIINNLIAGTGAVTITSVNNIGTITNAATSASSGATVISQGVGSNVTALINAATSTGLTVSTNALSVNASGTTLQTTGGGAITISGGVSGTGNLILDADSGGAINLTTTSVNNTGTISNTGSGVGGSIISATISSNISNLIQDSATSSLTLSASNSHLANTIKSGTLIGSTVAGAFGPGVITIGDTTGSANATLSSSFAGTHTNLITVASGSSGTANILGGGGATIFSGAITLNKSLSVTLASTALTLSGDITGTGDLTLSTNNLNALTLSGSSINNVGTITNNGSSSGVTTISGGVGVNVTDVIQNSATSSLVLTGTQSLSGNLTVTAGTFTAPSGNLTISGNLTVDGTFTHSSGTVIFNGAGISEIDGNNTVFNNFTVATNNKVIKFKQGETITINGLLTLTGTTGNNVVLDSIDGSTDWNINHQGTESVNYVTLNNSNCDALSTTITNTNTTDAGNNGNGDCWEFAVVVQVSGTSNTTGTVNIAVDGVLQAQTGTISGGSWSVAGVSGITSANQVVVVWIDNVADTAESTAVAKYDGSGYMTGLVLNKNLLSLGSNDNRSFSLTDLDTSGTGYDCTDDEDVMYSVASSTLSVEGVGCVGGANSYTNETLEIETGDTLTVGSSETLSSNNIINIGTLVQTTSGAISATGEFLNAGTFTGGSGSVTVGNFTNNSATFTSTSGTLTVSGDFINNNTFTNNSGTVLMDSSSTGGILNTGGSTLNNLNFNNASGGWTLLNDLIVAGNLTMTAGTLSGSANMSVAGSMTGDGTILLTGSSTNLYGLKKIAVGFHHTCAVSNSGRVYCWGGDGDGQLGNGFVITADQQTPTLVEDGAATGADTDGTYLINIKDISANAYSTCVVANSGKAYCWGLDATGSLGNGALGSTTSPTRVEDGAATGADTDGTYLANVKEIKIVAYGFTCAVTYSGKAYCWGDDTSGNLGNGSVLTANQETPTLVEDGLAIGSDTDGTYLANIKTIAPNGAGSCAVSYAGRMYCWGADAYGMLGNDWGITDQQDAPIIVYDGAATGDDSDGTYLTNVKSVAGGYFHTCALTYSGKVYCLGQDTHGEIGNGTPDSTAGVPFLVKKGVATGADTDGTNLTNIKSITAGGQHVCAISNSGKTYCWGQNTNGQLGSGAVTGDQFSPVFVEDGVATGADTDGTYLVNLSTMSGGDASTCAISNSGKTYCWGRDTWGGLGNGATAGDQNTPNIVLKGSVTETQALTLSGTGNFGGNTNWSFYNTTFGGITTATGAGSITTESVMTVASTKTLNAGSKNYILSGSGTPLATSGTFTVQTSTVSYTGSSATTITARTYNNMVVGAGATVTYSMSASPGTTLNGTLTVADGATLSLANITLVVTGATTIGSGTSGIINVAGAGSVGSYSFGDITVNAGGTFDLSTGTHITFLGGNIVHNGTTFNTGASATSTFTATKAISGASAMTFGATTQTINNSVIITNNNTNTVTFSGDLSGGGASAEFDTGLNSTTKFGGAVLTTGILVPSTSANTIEYTGATPTCKAPTTNNYYHLIFSGASGVITCSVTAVTGNVTESGGAGTSWASSLTSVGGTLSFARSFTATSGTMTVGAITKGGPSAAFSNNNGTVIVTSSMSAGGIGSLGFYNLQTAGTVSASGNIAVASNFSINSGIFTSTSANLTIAGNFTDAGTFTHNSGTVIFNGAGISQIDGNSTVFNNFTVATAGKTIKFKEGETVTFNGLFTLTGTTGNNVVLDSIDGSTNWTINHQGTESVDYVTVNHSTCDVSSTIITNTNTTDGGTNEGTCWGFSAGITISGSSNASGTVAVAVNGSLQVGKTATISGSAWSIGSVTVISGQVVTLWIDGAVNSGESTAVAKYDGTGGMTGMVLNTNVLSIGSVDNQSISLTDLDTTGNGFDCTDDEDVMYSVASSTLSVQGVGCTGGANSYTNETLQIETGDSLAVGNTETVNTDNMVINGTLAATGNSIFNVSGGWDNNATFTKGTSTVNFTSTGSETVDSTGAATPDFNIITFNGSGGDWTLASNLVASGNVSVTNGTLKNGGLGITGVGGATFTVSNDATFEMSGASSYPASFGAYSYGGTSNVSYLQTSGPAVAAASYGNLNLKPANSTPLVFSAGTISVAGDLVVGDGSNTGVTAATNNPTLSVAGNTTISSGATFVSGTGAWSQVGNLTVNGILSGTTNGTITTNGDVDGTGTINLTATGTFEQLVSGNTNFGPTGSNDWNFVDLTFGRIVGTPTVATNLSGTGMINISGILNIGKTGDGAVTRLDPGDVVWNLSSAGTPIVFNALSVMCPNDVCPTNTSTFNFTHSAGAGSINITPAGYYNLGVGTVSDSNSASTFTLGANTIVSNVLTVGNGSSTNADVFSTGADRNLHVGLLVITPKGVVNANGSVITITDAGMTNDGEFNRGTSTVVVAHGFLYDPNGDVNATPPTQAAFGGASTTNFYNFSSTLPRTKIAFNSGSDFGFYNDLNLVGGVEGGNILLDSIDGSGQWNIYIDSGATLDMRFVVIRNSACAVGTQNIPKDKDRLNGGNNGPCWSFIDKFIISPGSINETGGGTPMNGGGRGHGGSRSVICSDASATATLSGDGVASADVTDGGNCYKEVPSVFFCSAVGSGATGDAVVSDGHVASINITSAGALYLSAPLVIISQSDGSGGGCPSTGGGQGGGGQGGGGDAP